MLISIGKLQKSGTMATIRCDFNTFESVNVGMHTIDHVKTIFYNGLFERSVHLVKRSEVDKRVLLWH